MNTICKCSPEIKGATCKKCQDKDKHPGGRPKLFDSSEELQEKIDQYFQEKDGQKISWTGLCIALGASSRQALESYKEGKHGKEFIDPIKKALLKVENYYEEEKDDAKGIFVLKNFGWTDKQEHDINISDVELVPPEKPEK